VATCSAALKMEAAKFSETLVSNHCAVSQIRRLQPTSVSHICYITKCFGSG